MAPTVAAPVAIVPFVADVTTSLVLGATDLSGLIGIDAAIGAGAALELADARLLGLQRVILPASQVALAKPLLNALLLADLALVDLALRAVPVVGTGSRGHREESDG